MYLLEKIDFSGILSFNIIDEEIVVVVIKKYKFLFFLLNSSTKFKILSDSPTLAALNQINLPCGLSKLEIPFLSRIRFLSSLPLINLYLRNKNKNISKYLVAKK